MALVWSDGPVVIRHSAGSETVQDGTATQQVGELVRARGPVDLTAEGPELLGQLEAGAV